MKKSEIKDLEWLKEDFFRVMSQSVRDEKDQFDRGNNWAWEEARRTLHALLSQMEGESHSTKQEERVVPQWFHAWYQEFHKYWTNTSVAKSDAIRRINQVGHGYPFTDIYGNIVREHQPEIQKNQEFFTRAVLDGYIIEKETKYRVQVGGHFVKFDQRGNMSTTTRANSIITKSELYSLGFDIDKAVESGLATIEEVEN